MFYTGGRPACAPRILIYLKRFTNNSTTQNFYTVGVDKKGTERKRAAADFLSYASAMSSYISVLRICRVFLIHRDDGRKGDRKDRKEGTERSAGKALKRARRFFEMKNSLNF